MDGSTDAELRSATRKALDGNDNLPRVTADVAVERIVLALERLADATERTADAAERCAELLRELAPRDTRH